MDGAIEIVVLNVCVVFLMLVLWIGGRNLLRRLK
jgi:hypothetical protein